MGTTCSSTAWRRRACTWCVSRLPRVETGAEPVVALGEAIRQSGTPALALSWYLALVTCCISPASSVAPRCVDVSLLRHVSAERSVRPRLEPVSRASRSSETAGTSVKDQYPHPPCAPSCARTARCVELVADVPRCTTEVDQCLQLSVTWHGAPASDSPYMVMFEHDEEQSLMQDSYMADIKATPLVRLSK